MKTLHWRKSTVCHRPTRSEWWWNFSESKVAWKERRSYPRSGVRWPRVRRSWLINKCSPQDSYIFACEHIKLIQFTSTPLLAVGCASSTAVTVMLVKLVKSLRVMGWWASMWAARVNPLPPLHKFQCSLVPFVVSLAIVRITTTQPSRLIMPCFRTCEHLSWREC